jgi:hypothetical protein
MNDKIYDKEFYENWFRKSDAEDDIGYQNNAKYLYSVIPAEYLDKINKVAEVGGCTGGNLFYFGKYKNFQTLDNYELSEDAINHGKQRYVNVNQIHMNFLEESVQKKYDLLLLSDIVEHFKDDNGFLEKIKKKTEYIALKMPIEKAIYTQLKRYFSRNPVVVGENHPSGHYHEYTVKETLSLINKHFEILSFFLYSIQQDKEVLEYNNARFHQNKKIKKMFYMMQRLFYKCVPLSVFITIFGGNVFLFAKTKNDINTRNENSYESNNDCRNKA